MIQNLEVGSTLIDHLHIFGVTFSSNLTEPLQPLRQQIRDFIHGYGTLTTAVSQDGIGYYQTPIGKIKNYPNLEIGFAATNYSSFALMKAQKWKKDILKAISGIDKSSSFSLQLIVLHTKSTGSIRLKNSSPFEYPLIDSNCLSDPRGEDLEAAYQAIQFASQLANTEAFRRINAKLEMEPIRQCSKYKLYSKDYWYCALRYITTHDNHPVATCKMGPSPSKGDVVDANLRVHGVKGLRVADASVIPLSTSAHINSVCYMIAEKLADMLKHEYGVKS